MEDLISVIVPVYKVEKYLRKCIESIINQTYKNLEIILVDDGSPDNCSQIIDEYAKKDNRIKVIHKPNGGLSSARNAGLKISNGKYIAFVDSDDMLDIYQYERMIMLSQKYNSDIVFCEYQKSYENELGEIIIPDFVREKVEEKIYTPSEALKEMLLNANIGTYVMTKLFKKELFDNIIFPEGKVYEDVATVYKLIDKSNKIVYTNEKLYYYLYGRAGAITSSFTEKKITDSLEAHYGLYLFLKNNYNELSEVANITWAKMYTSAMEKICMNNYDTLWFDEDILNKYNEFKKAIDELQDSKLCELEPYRLISAVLLRRSRELYKSMFKTLFDNLKNK